MANIGWWSRLTRRFQRPATREARDDRAKSLSHLEQFVLTRAGVEMWVEAPTHMSRTSVLLVARDGESTRRTVPSPQWAREFAKGLSLPCYDAGVVPYPQRMRDWNRQHRQGRSESGHTG